LTLSRIEQELRRCALAYPEATEEFPWGDRVAKVRGKIFAFVGLSEGEVRLTVKLPQSADAALALPRASPTSYGLGKAGWVTLRFAKGDTIAPLAVLREWIDESYRAVAPKRLVAALEEAPSRKKARK
jgi:predicted DNA-binding protein (MmcQ/YjbR family)